MTRKVKKGLSDSKDDNVTSDKDGSDNINDYITNVNDGDNI